MYQAVRSYVERSMRSALDQIAELKTLIHNKPSIDDVRSLVLDDVRSLVKTIVPEKGDKGDKGDSVDIEVVTGAVTARVLEEIELPKDGTSVTAEEVLPALKQDVEAFLKTIPVPKDGVSVDVEKVVGEITSKALDEVNKYFTELQESIVVPKDGTSVTIGDVLPTLMEDVEAFLKAIPLPKDGTSVSIDDVLPPIQEGVNRFIHIQQEALHAQQLLVQKAVEEIPVPKSVTVDEVMPSLQQSVKEFLTAQEELVKARLETLPIPKDGTSVTVEDFKPLLERNLHDWNVRFKLEAEEFFNGQTELIQGILAEVSSTVEATLDELTSAAKAIPVPKDGTSVTLEDVRPLIEQNVNGWALDFERRAQDTLQRAVERLPEPKAGKNGVDGLGFDDLNFEYDGERKFTLSFIRGDIVKKFEFNPPIPLDRGVYKEGIEYERGDIVTWAGSSWTAQDTTKSKPSEGGAGWRLSTKRGRDGKDAVTPKAAAPTPLADIRKIIIDDIEQRGPIWRALEKDPPNGR
jgi:hypothetical protein